MQHEVNVVFIKHLFEFDITAAPLENYIEIVAPEILNVCVVGESPHDLDYKIDTCPSHNIDSIGKAREKCQCMQIQLDVIVLDCYLNKSSLTTNMQDHPPDIRHTKRKPPQDIDGDKRKGQRCCTPLPHGDQNSCHPVVLEKKL